jgi:hypothetical protein
MNQPPFRQVSAHHFHIIKTSRPILIYGIARALVCLLSQPKLGRDSVLNNSFSKPSALTNLPTSLISFMELEISTKPTVVKPNSAAAPAQKPAHLDIFPL